jgi:hypothetical protein
MENKRKQYFHGLGKIFYDVLRDTNSTKYSMTKFAALFGVLALMGTITMSLIIMWQKKEIDHVLIVEVIGFVLTVLGFKNNFGLNLSKDSKILTQNSGDGLNNIEKQKELLVENNEKDETNDLKG